MTRTARFTCGSRCEHALASHCKGERIRVQDSARAKSAVTGNVVCFIPPKILTVLD